MLKKIVFSLILAIFLLAIFLILPRKISDPFFTYFSFPKMSDNKTDISIMLVGDIMLGRSVMNESFNKKDFTYPFKNVASILTDADIVLGNLEVPIIKDCPFTTTGMKFCARPEMIEGLKFAGINIVSLANNHTGNYGKYGFEETKKYLSENGIDFLDGDNLVIKQIDGTKFGFLGFNFLYRIPNENELKLIEESRQKVDVLLVMLHWGEEYTSKPTDFQKEIAQILVDKDVDVIVGTHPHWVQDFDKINEKFVFYSLGNFVFDQAWSEETKKGMAVRLIYQKHRLSRIDKIPVYMDNFAQPKWGEIKI